MHGLACAESLFKYAFSVFKYTHTLRFAGNELRFTSYVHVHLYVD